MPQRNDTNEANVVQLGLASMALIAGASAGDVPTVQEDGEVAYEAPNGGSLPDPVTEIVNIDVADTGDTWTLSTMVPDGLSSNIAFGNATWDNTEPEGCGLIAGQENGDLQMSVKFAGRQLRLGNNQGGVVLLSLEPADGELGNNELCIWFDSTPGASKLMVKARNNTGSIVTATVPLA